MKFKKMTLAALVSTITLAGCGGGGGSDNTNPINPDNEPPAFEPNKAARALIGASDALAAPNVVIAVADAGVNSDHNEFDGTAIDGRSGAFASELLLDASFNLNYVVDTIATDDYFPDYEPGRDFAEAGHGTHVASLIFGKKTGLLTDGTLLAMDVVYSGSVDEGTFDPIGNRPSSIASIMATTQMAASNKVDFLNMSIEGAAKYFNSAQDGGLQFDIYMEIDGSGVGVIAAAGNFAIDYSEIYVSSTPDCTAEEKDEAAGNAFALERCFLLQFSRYEDDFIPYDNDDLRDDFLLVVAVDDNREVASFSSIPGSEPKIQERFIAAPGVNLDVADHKDNADYTTNSGTSFAAPLVTAAAGAVKSKFPSLTSAAVLQILLDTASKDFTGYDAAKHGMGILDVEAALNISPNDYIL